MIALLSLIYGSFYFLFFKKLKLFAESVRNISIFVGIGVVLIGAVVYAWWTFAPTTADGRVFQYVIPIVPNVKGQVVEVPIEVVQNRSNTVPVRRRPVGCIDRPCKSATAPGRNRGPTRHRTGAGSRRCAVAIGPVERSTCGGSSLDRQPAGAIGQCAMATR